MAAPPWQNRAYHSRLQLSIAGAGVCLRRGTVSALVPDAYVLKEWDEQQKKLRANCLHAA
jgi:hypothetical protein